MARRRESWFILFLFHCAEGIVVVTNIYVGNLSFNATEDEIRAAFEPFGTVSSVSVIKDRETGRSRGFAFVEMPDGGEAQAAIENLNLKEIAGRSITVNEARPRQERPRGGGGGGGGRGGRGGGGGRGRW
jgi:cold-inducible RNA-binding protein